MSDQYEMEEAARTVVDSLQLQIEEDRDYEGELRGIEIQLVYNGSDTYSYYTEHISSVEIPRSLLEELLEINQDE